ERQRTRILTPGLGDLPARRRVRRAPNAPSRGGTASLRERPEQALAEVLRRSGQSPLSLKTVAVCAFAGALYTDSQQSPLAFRSCSRRGCVSVARLGSASSVPRAASWICAFPSGPCLSLICWMPSG